MTITPAELAQMKARAETWLGDSCWLSSLSGVACASLARKDYPRLITEVEALQAALRPIIHYWRDNGRSGLIELDTIIDKARAALGINE